MEKYALVLDQTAYVFDDSDERLRVINTLINAQAFKTDYATKMIEKEIPLEFTVFIVKGEFKDAKTE